MNYIIKTVRNFTKHQSNETVLIVAFATVMIVCVGNTNIYDDFEISTKLKKYIVIHTDNNYKKVKQKVMYALKFCSGKCLIVYLNYLVDTNYFITSK